MKTICLRKGEVVRSEGATGALMCRRGRLWITQAGFDRDVLLYGGETFHPQPTGLVVIEALENACLDR